LLDEDVNDSVKILTGKLSAALATIHAKEESVKQHAKVAEEAVAGSIMLFFLSMVFQHSFMSSSSPWIMLNCCELRRNISLNSLYFFCCEIVGNQHLQIYSATENASVQFNFRGNIVYARQPPTFRRES